MRGGGDPLQIDVSKDVTVLCDRFFTPSPFSGPPRSAKRRDGNEAVLPRRGRSAGDAATSAPVTNGAYRRCVRGVSLESTRAT